LRRFSNSDLSYGGSESTAQFDKPFTMQAIEFQFRAALAFAYTFVIGRVIASAAMGSEINVLAVVATYLLLGAVALVLRRTMPPDGDAKQARTMAYVTLGALAATAPAFW
jgi:hypothetical protein